MNRAELLDAAKKCVCGDREQDYGTPEDNFSVIAGLWSECLGVQLDGVDVAAMMVLLKIGRISSSCGRWTVSRHGGTMETGAAGVLFPLIVLECGAASHFSEEDGEG